MGGKFFSINCCRGNDDPEVFSLYQQLCCITKEKVDIQAAFVCFIDNECIVCMQTMIRPCFSQQHTVCHKFYFCISCGFILKTDFVADKITIFCTEFLGDSLSDSYGSDSTRLGTAYHFFLAAACVEAHFRQLCGFP